MPDYQFLLTETHQGAGLVRFNRPKELNALNSTLMEELVTALEAFDADPAIGCLVVTGSARAFAAGADIKEMAEASAVDMLQRDNIARWDRLRKLKKPLLAAVSGFCLGGGIGLVGNADAIVASEDATFGLPELDRGALGAATHLARLVPQHLMRALYYTSRTATAAMWTAEPAVMV